MINNKSTVFDCSTITLPKNHQINGHLTAVSNGVEMPFDVKRIYYLYDIPSSSKRGGHSHKKLQQILIAISGSFDVVLKDGKTETTITLNKPFEGLLITNEIWRELKNFSSGAVCLVIASDVFSEEDYIRELDDFLATKF